MHNIYGISGSMGNTDYGVVLSLYNPKFERYIPLNIVNEVLKEKMDMSGDTNGITHEMLEVLEYFNKTYV